jgi:AraC-like DNA-binding protein
MTVTFGPIADTFAETFAFLTGGRPPGRRAPLAAATQGDDYPATGGRVVPDPEVMILNKDVFEMYRGSDVILPDLLGLGWCRTLTPRFGGPRTDGSIGFEVGYLEHGSIEWMTPAGLDEAGPGSVIIDPPGDWQGGVSAVVHPCVRYWLRFNFPPQGALPGLGDTTIAALAAGFAAIRSRHFPASPEIRTQFERLIGQQRAPGRFAVEIARAALHQILCQTVIDHERDAGANHSRPIRRALAYLDQHVAGDCRVEDVAGAVDLSVGYFHDLFVREVGMTPGQYHARKRVAAAKRQLIYSDASVTDISMALGFSSSQYFATAFKKIVGMTPGDYRRLREGRFPVPGMAEAKALLDIADIR